MPQAIYCFLISNSFEDCLRKYLSIGGDADTIAAIAFSISEAFYDIPENIQIQALSYLPSKYKLVVDKFYSILSLKKQLLELGICHDEFWEYMRTHTKRISFPSETGICGTFTEIDENNRLSSVKILVPEISDEKTLLINIHEYAHAYELYNELGSCYKIDKEHSEAFAVSKEQEYLAKKNL